MKGIALMRKYTDVIISRSPPSWCHTARRPPSPPSWPPSPPPPSPPPPPPLHWRSASSEGGQGKQLQGGINFKAVINCDWYATVDFVISRTSPPPPLKWSSLKRKKLVRKSFKLDLVLKPHPVDFDFLTVSYISSFHLNATSFLLVSSSSFTNSNSDLFWTVFRFLRIMSLLLTLMDAICTHISIFTLRE